MRTQMFQILFFGPRINKTYKRKYSKDEIEENWQQCPCEFYFPLCGRREGHCIYYLYFSRTQQLISNFSCLINALVHNLRKNGLYFD